MADAALFIGWGQVVRGRRNAPFKYSTRASNTGEASKAMAKSRTSRSFS